MAQTLPGVWLTDGELNELQRAHPLPLAAHSRPQGGHVGLQPPDLASVRHALLAVSELGQNAEPPVHARLRLHVVQLRKGRPQLAPGLRRAALLHGHFAAGHPGGRVAGSEQTAAERQGGSLGGGRETEGQPGQPSSVPPGNARNPVTGAGAGTGTDHARRVSCSLRRLSSSSCSRSRT